MRSSPIKDFTPEEAVRCAEQLEPIFKKLAQANQKAGKSADGKAGGRGRKKNLGKTLPKVSREPRTMDSASAAVGMTRPTLEKAKAVVASKNRTLIDEMNRTGKVSAEAIRDRMGDSK